MRRTLALTAGLLSLTGCAQIFGLDETSSSGDTDNATLTLAHASVGATVTTNPLDVSMVTATFLADDGAGGYQRVPGSVTAPGVFTAPMLDGAPPVQFMLPGTTGDRIWATGARAQKGTVVAFEHPGVEAPLPGSIVAVSAMLPTPSALGETFRVEIIGAWMRGALMTPATTGATVVGESVPYSAFTPMLGNAPARFTSADVVLVLRYNGSQLTGVLQQQLDQTDGTDMIEGPMTAVSTAESSLMATIDPVTLMTRYTAVLPTLTTTSVAQSFFVRAAPGAELGQPQGTVLVSGSPMPTDMAITAAFGNPFTSLGWKSLVEYATSMSRTYMIDATHSVALSATLTTVAEVGAEPLTFDSPAGLPITIQINAMPLTTDGTAVSLDLTRPVVVDATLDKPDNTAYAARLFELDASGTTVAKNLVAEMVVTGMPQFAFPPELFISGHTYFVQVAAYQGGFEAAASGDLQTVTLPYTTGTLDSGVFTVMP